MNLKQAAQQLGVHYQTAYKLVRSGRLAAVCVGARYEISEAAIERYLAERQAMRRAPARARTTAAPTPGGSGDPFAAARAALEATPVSGTTVAELVADALASVVGDVALVREFAPDHETFLPSVVRHADPARRAIVAATIGETALEVRNSRVLANVAEGKTVLKAIVPQDCVRTNTDPEAVQYLDDAGFHSMVVAPAKMDGTVVGLVAITRDAPGSPYARAHADLVETAASLVGTAIARARVASEAQHRRRSLVAAVTDLLDGGETGPSVQTMLGHGTIAEMVCDTTGRIVAANDAAAGLLDSTTGALVGRRFHEVVTPAARDRQRALLERLLRGELAFADEHLELVQDSGATTTVSTRFAVVRDVRAHPRAFVVVAHEVPSHAS